ncbi:hypothetical protein [Citrobacter sp. Cpo086]|uniref:hypothetical protein n=1 Tax=Citrobacter sp. Cpo086 TaxID=2985137 RepID=UPI00336A8A08
MPTNDIKPFAAAGGANVLTQAEYLALAALSTGFSSGKANSKEVNKAIRQATFAASALAQFICDKSGSDVLDDGNVAGLVTKLLSAINKTSQPLDATLTAFAGLVGAANKLPYFNGTDTAALTDLTSVGRDIIGKNAIADVLTYLGIDRVEQFNNETKIYAGDDHSIFLSIRIDGLWGIYDPLHGFIPLGIGQGGTGAGDAAGARQNLELGDSSTKNTGTTANTVAAGDDSRFSLMLGVGQSWQNVTGNRFSGTVYTNNTGKPIQVFALWNDTPPTDWGYGVGTLTFSGPYDASGLALGFLSLVVPAGDTYFMRNPNISHWWELR